MTISIEHVNDYPLIRLEVQIRIVAADSIRFDSNGNFRFAGPYNAHGRLTDSDFVSIHGHLLMFN